jgi:hypothetical protein
VAHAGAVRSMRSAVRSQAIARVSAAAVAAQLHEAFGAARVAHVETALRAAVPADECPTV